MNYTKQFRDRSASLLSSLKCRSKQKRDKRGRVTRRGYELPFDLEQFRAWLVTAYDGGDGLTCRYCRYCTRPVDVYSCTIDHDVPLGRGGSPDLSNLCADVCEPCNQCKGTLTGEEFKHLLEYLRTMGAKFGNAPVISISSRLQKATKLAAQARWNMSRKKKAKVIEEDKF